MPNIYLYYTILFLLDYIFPTQVPMLVPGMNYSFESLVTCLSEKGISDNVKVGGGGGRPGCLIVFKINVNQYF